MNRSKRSSFATAALTSLALLGGCASMPAPPPPLAAGDYPTVWRHLEQLIEHGMRADEVAGLSIAVVDDQRVIWSNGFGWADANNQVKATDRTLYRMGSISKLFTSTAAMQLAQQGLLDIDAPIEKALPQWPIPTNTTQTAITPRLLMTHHAGLTRDVGQGMWGGQVGRFQDMVQALEPTAQAYPPKLLLSYSNVGMTVLGAAVEQVAGEPFEAHLKNTLLNPLGMDSAYFSSTAGDDLSRAHKGGKSTSEPALRDVPAGALNASVLDMSRFMMMVFANGKSSTGKTVLEPAQLAEMLRVQNADNALNFDLRTGLGWMLHSIGPDTLKNAGVVAHHGGATTNFHSQLYVLPKHKLGVIVTANSASAQKLVDAVAKRALGLVLEAKTGIQQPQEQPVVASDTQELTEAQLATCNLGWRLRHHGRPRARGAQRPHIERSHIWPKAAYVSHPGRWDGRAIQALGLVGVASQRT